MADVKPLQTLDALDWRTTPPDAPGWWAFVSTPGHVRLMQVEDDEVGRMPDGWRCAPILDPAATREAARREALEEAAGIVAEVAAAGRRCDGRADARAGGWRGAADHVADRIRARIPAPPAEAHAHTNSAQVGTTLVDAPSDAELRALRALECKMRESNYMTPGVHRALAALDKARGDHG